MNCFTLNKTQKSGIGKDGDMIGIRLKLKKTLGKIISENKNWKIRAEFKKKTDEIKRTDWLCKAKI